MYHPPLRKMKTIKIPVFGSMLLWLLTAGSLRAGLLAYEGFNYTNSANTHLVGGNGGIGWSNSWYGTDQDAFGWTDVSYPGFSFSQSNRSLVVTGGKGDIIANSGAHAGVNRNLNVLPGGPFDALLETGSGLIGKAGTDVWFGFLLNPTIAHSGQTGVLPGVYLSPGLCGVGFDSLQNKPNFAPNVPVNFGQTYSVVIHIMFGGGGNDSLVEYYNPVPGGSAPLGAQGTNQLTGDFRFSFVNLNGGGTAGFATAMQVDEIRLGTTYADVAPTLIPPLYLMMVSNAPVLVWPDDGAAHTVQTTTNLSSGPWVTVSNPVPMVGVYLTNSPVPPNAFFRLQ